MSTYHVQLKSFGQHNEELVCDCCAKFITYIGHMSIIRDVFNSGSMGTLFSTRGHSTTTWTRRGGEGVSQKSMLVHSGAGVP